MKYVSVFCLLLIMVAGSGFSQENRLVLTLEDAQTYALKHNKTLINATKDLQLASEQIKEAKGAGLPQVNASVDYSTNFNYEFALDFGSGSGETPQIDYTLLDAGDLEVLNMINQMFGSSSGTTIIMEDQASANIQVTQLLFSGQYWVGVQLAKIGKKIAEQNVSLTELDVREGVINNYYLILVTKRLLKIIHDNQKNLEDILKHTSDMYITGMAEETDVDQIKVSLSQMSNSRRMMERNLQVYENMFRILLGADSSFEIVLSDSLEGFLNNLDQDKIWLEQFELANNPTYQIMQAQEEIGKKKVDMQKWAYAPTLAGYYSYKEKLLTTSFDLSPKNAAGLSLSIPVFSGGTKKAQLSKAEIELDKITRSKALLEEQLALQEKQYLFELKSAYDNYLTQKENVAVAKRFYANINNKYKQGLMSSLDLTQANSNYLQAENNYVTAIMDLLQSKLKLNKLYNNF